MKYLILLLLPLAASAQETLNFDSGPITSAFTSESGQTLPAPELLGTDITGVITLSSALPANGVTTVTPVSESFSLNVGHWDLFSSTTYTFTTQNGAITAYDFTTRTPWGWSYSSTLQGNNASGVYAIESYPQGATDVSTNSGGHWYDPNSNSIGGVRVHGVPEIDPTSGIAALTLLAGLLVVLRSKFRA